MERKFLISYTVKSQKDDDACQELADLVRRDIAKNSFFFGLEELETTRHGIVNTTSSYARGRRNELQEFVNDIFTDILVKHKASKKYVVIHCAAMLEDSGGELLFEVSYKA